MFKSYIAKCVRCRESSSLSIPIIITVFTGMSHSVPQDSSPILNLLAAIRGSASLKRTLLNLSSETSAKPGIYSAALRWRTEGRLEHDIECLDILPWQHKLLALIYKKNPR